MTDKSPETAQGAKAAKQRAGTFTPGSRGRRKSRKPNAEAVQAAAEVAATEAAQPDNAPASDAAAAESQQAATASAAADIAHAGPEAQAATDQPAASDAKPSANASVVQLRQRGETASERVARLKREISAAEADKSGIEQAIAALAIECEAGDAEALAKRAELRAELATCTDRIGDKQAALAAAEPLAAVEARHEAVQRRNAALDQASAYFGHVAGWGEQIDKALGQLLMAFKNMRTCQTAAIATMHYHTPESMRWLLEMNEGALQGVLMARLVREGVLGADEFDPGPAFTGRVTVGEAIGQHVDAVRERIAALRADERVADASEIIASSSGSVWDPPSANRPHRFTHTIGPAIPAAIAKD